MTFFYINMRIITVVLIANLFSLFTISSTHAYTSLLYEECAKGNGVEKTVKRALPAINILEISGPLTVNIKSDQLEQHVRITGDENILDLIKTVPHGNKLLVFPEKQICTDLELTIDITVSNLVALVTTNAGDLKVTGVNTQRFSLVSTDSGDISLTGQTYLLSAEVSGINDLNAGELKTWETNLHLSGNGMANITVSEKLTVNIVGLADVYYSGDPKEIIKDFIGAGTLNKIE